MTPRRVSSPSCTASIFEYVVIARARMEKIEATLRRDPEV
jgi:hypothetical protein